MPSKLITSVLLGHYLSAFAALGIPLFLPRFLEALAPNTPDWTIGILFVLPTLCTALTAPLWGKLADHFGCRLSLLRAHAGLCAGFLLASFSPNLTVFIFALVIQGAFGGALSASNAYLATQLQGKRLSYALNWTQYSARLAMVTGPIVVGMLTTWGMGLEIYRVFAGLSLLAFVLIIPLPNDSPAAHRRVSIEGNQANRLPTDLPALLGVQFLFSFATVVTFPYFVLYGEALQVGSDVIIALLYSLPHLVYLVGLPWAHRQAANLLLPGLALLALGNALQFLSASADLLPALRLLTGAGMLLAFIGLHRCLSDRSRDGAAGRLFGWYDSSGKWAGAAAGVAAALLSQSCGIASPFLAGALAAVAALVLARPMLSSNKPIAV